MDNAWQLQWQSAAEEELCLLDLIIYLDDVN